MNKLLLILIAFISVTCTAQEIKISNLPASTDPDANDIMIINEDNTTSKITKWLLQQGLSDSLLAVYDSLVAHDGKINVNISNISTNTTNISTNVTGISDLEDTIVVHDGKINVNIGDIDTSQDSILGNRLTIEYMRDELINLGGWEITITDNGDSLQFTLGSQIFKIATGSSTATDITPPTVASAEIGNLADDSVAVVLSEAVLTDSIPDTIAFKVYVDASEVAVDTLTVYEQAIHLKLASTVDSSQNIYGQYVLPDTGRIQDAANNFMKSQTFPIINNTRSTQVTAFAGFLFENDVNDEKGNLTLVKSAAASYESGGNLIQGSYSAHLNGGDRFFWTHEVTLGNLFYIPLRWRKWIPGSPATYTLASTLDVAGDGNGMEFRYNAVTDKLELYTSDGSSTTTATSNVINYSSNDVTESAVSVDVANGEVKFTHEGVDVTDYTNDDIEDDFDTTDSIFFGAQKDSTNECFCFIDDAWIYKDTASTAKALENYNNGADPVILSGSGPQPDPTPSDSFNVTKLIDFSNAPGPFPNTDLVAADWTSLDSDFRNIEGESESPPVVDEGEFRIVSSDTVLRSTYPQWECCTETDPSGSIGTGVNVRYWLNTAQDDFTNGVLEYKVYFPSNFDSGLGGKLLRLTTWEKWCHNNGASVGLMFGKDATGQVTVQWYIYDYTDDYTGCIHVGGAPYGTVAWLTKGEWHTIGIRFNMGTVGTSDGWYELYIDGVRPDRGGLIENRHIRRSSDKGYNILEISTFAGGDKPEKWNMPVQTYLDIDDIVFGQFHPNYSQFPGINTYGWGDWELNLPY